MTKNDYVNFAKSKYLNLEVRKYYFLNSKKQWRGPYTYLQILFFAFKGAIEPHTYIWHNKLKSDIGQHPLKSAYNRVKAYQFRNLPIWVFGYNLKIMLSNLFGRAKKMWQDDDFEKFAAKTIETPAILENAVALTLLPSFTAIHDFTGSGNFKVSLIYLDREDEKKVKVGEYPARLMFDEHPGIGFEITMFDPPAVGGVDHLESYGLHRQLGFISESEVISVAKNSVYDFSTRFPYKPQTLKGRLKQANLLVDGDYKNNYNRLMLTLTDDKVICLQDIVETTGAHIYDHEPLNVHGSLMGLTFKTGGTYTDVDIAGLKYSMYSVNTGQIFVDGYGREDLIDFKQKAEIIRVAFALLSGKFYGGKCLYVTSNEADFKEIDGVWYELERSPILSNRRVIDLQTFRLMLKHEDPEQLKQYKEIDKRISGDVFSALCKALLENESLLHAANLVISGMGNIDPLQQGALYAVALETLTTALGEQKAKDLKPIADKNISKAFVADLKSVLAKYEADLSEEAKTILTKNIEGVNRPTNRDKLVKTFDLYGITLSDLDKNTIDKRNDYLHGRNPLDLSKQFELTQISLRLHSLIVALFLKSVGYEGHVINLDIHIYLTDEEKMMELAAAEGNAATAIIEAIEKAKVDGDRESFDALRAELGQHIANNKFTNLIRII